MGFSGSRSNVFEIEKEKEVFEVKWKKELILFLNISGPTLISNVVGQAQWLISSSFAGRELGADALGAISLTLLAALVARSFMIGIHSGFATLAGNAYGEKSYSEVGYLLQSTFLLCGSLVLPMALFYLNVHKFLSILGQPESIVELASEYLYVYIFILPAETSYEIIKKFYQCQNVTYPFIIIKCIATTFHYFVIHLLRNIMVSFFFTEWLTLILATQIFRLNQHEKTTWPGFKLSKALETFRLKRILRLGLPGILALSEWWFYEFQTILVGSINATALAAHSIAYFIIPFCFHIPYGFGNAAQTRISVLIGENNIEFARKISIGTLSINFLVGFTTATLSFIYRDWLFTFFIEDNEQVISLAIKIWPMVCVYMIFDSSLASSMCILRGLGHHALLAKIIAVTLWIIGVPLELFFLRYLDWGLYGLWFGMLIIYFLMCLAFVYYLCSDKVYEIKYQRIASDEDK